MYRSPFKSIRAKALEAIRKAGESLPA